MAWEAFLRGRPGIVGTPCASIGLVTLDQRPGISGLTTDELSAWLVERGEPAYRARQIGDAVWRGDARTAADIRTLPAPLREALDDGVHASTPSPRPRCARPTAG